MEKPTPEQAAEAVYADPEDWSADSDADPDAYQYWKAGSAQGLESADAAILKREDACRANGAKKCEVANVFGRSAPPRVDLDIPYSRIYIPAPFASRVGQRPPLVETEEEAKVNLWCLTQGLTETLLGGLPFVIAGGVVLGALHEWPQAFHNKLYEADLQRECDTIKKVFEKNPRCFRDGAIAKLHNFQNDPIPSEECWARVGALQKMLAGNRVASSRGRKTYGTASFMQSRVWARGHDSTIIKKLYASRLPSNTATRAWTALKRATFDYDKCNDEEEMAGLVAGEAARAAQAATRDGERPEATQRLEKALIEQGEKREKSARAHAEYVAAQQAWSNVEFPWSVRGGERIREECRPFSGTTADVGAVGNITVVDAAPRRFLARHLPPELAAICLEYHAPPTCDVLSYATPRARALRSFRGSDVDLFVVGADAARAEQAIVELHRRLVAQIPEPFEVSRTAGAVTFHLPRPYPKVQVVLRLYESVGQVLMGFDLDCCAIAYDGKEGFLASPRGLRSLQTRQNIVNPSRQSTTYEVRLLKYARRGFAVAIPGATAEYLAAREADAQRYLKERPQTVELKGITLLLAMMVLIREKSRKTPFQGHGVITDGVAPPSLARLYWDLGFNPNIADYDLQEEEEGVGKSKPRELPRPQTFVCSTDIARVLYTNAAERKFYVRRGPADGRRRNPRSQQPAAVIPYRLEFVSSQPWVQGRHEAASAAALQSATEWAAALKQLSAQSESIRAEVAYTAMKDEKEASARRATMAEDIRKLHVDLMKIAEDTGRLAARFEASVGEAEAASLTALMVGGGAPERRLYTGSFNATNANWYEPIAWK